MLAMARRRPAEERLRREQSDLVVLLVWGVCTLASLAAFDLVPAPAAGLLTVSLTAAGATGMLLYLRRPVPGAVITPRLLVMLAGYHVLVLMAVMGGVAVLLGHKPALLGTLAGVLDAAPALAGAVLLWRRMAARRDIERWA
jgi:hypothetical protein